MYSGYPNDVNNSMSFYDVYSPGATIGAGNVGVPAGNNGVSAGPTFPAGGGAVANAGAAAGGQAVATAAAPTGGFLGQPVTWWVAILATFAAFVWVARKWGGGAERFHNIRMSVYNGVFLTFWIVLVLNFLKVIAARFPIPGFSKLVLAA